MRLRTRRMAFALAAMASPAVAFAACGGPSAPNGNAAGGGSQGFEQSPCDVLPASKLDATGMATLVLSKQPDGTCYWIDKTEVTVQEYSQFLAAAVAQPSGWGPQCSWKTTPSNPVAETSDPCTVTTNMESDPFRATKPIRCVDWCDARAYCMWAGKDLCGGETNGSLLEPVDVPDQWGNACSADGSPYPNGATPVDGECNAGLSEDGGQCFSLLHQNDCAPTDVGSFPGCTSPGGAEDMIGNVAEWVVSCAVSADGGPDTLCQIRGGAFLTPLEDGTCYGVAAMTLGTRDRSVGLRCCAALTQDEHKLVTGATK